MIKLVLCDDNPVELRSSAKLLEEYQKASDADLSVRILDSSKALLKAIEKEEFHIYLLDIKMPGPDGLKLGENIRKKDDEAFILYLTNYPEYALDAYRVSPFQYLIKPVNQETLFPILDKLVKRLSGLAKEVLWIRTSNGTCSVRIWSVLFIEYHAHFLSYHLDDENVIRGIVTNVPFSQLAVPYLKDDRFIKISPSILVNPGAVKSIGRTSLLLKNGISLPVSRSYGDARKKFYDFIMKEGSPL